MSIRVATLNVWSLPAGLAKHKPQRMRAIYERVAGLNLDVVAFQEVWTQESLDALVAGSKRAGFEHTWHNPEPASGSGLLVISKLPIVKTHFEAFEAKGHSERLNHFDYYSGKGIALVTVEAPFGAVTLLDTHLHANYAPAQGLDEYKGIRAVQVLQLVTSVANLRTPLIALGDFNLEETETSYRVLLGLSGLRDTAVDLGVVQPTWISESPYQTVGQSDKRIDYIFCRDGHQQGIEPRKMSREFAEALDFDGVAGGYSDHAGLVAEFAPVPARAVIHPDHDAALALAAGLLDAGRAIATQRQFDQRLTSGGALAVGIATYNMARFAAQNRRRFLKNVLGFASSASFAMLAGNLALSEWINPKEVAVYDHAEQQLARIQADLRRN
ncbi:MAG TPA: hypothetical protein EYG46_00070 [Myxococcales bacterium]|nr:hypothetical protein [Myxococcales bacterium]